MSSGNQDEMPENNHEIYKLIPRGSIAFTIPEKINTRPIIILLKYLNIFILNKFSYH